MNNSGKTDSSSFSASHSSIFNPKSKVFPVSQSPESKVILRSAKNSPLFLYFSSPSEKNSELIRFTPGERLREKAKNTNFPKISKFELEEENLVKVESSEPVPQCRICLDSENKEDFIIPCRCKGFQKHVHQGCLKLWLLKSEKIDSEISSCEVCKARYLMKFHYENFIAPCNENACKSWLPFVISCIMIMGILCFYFQGYIKESSGGMMVLAISIVFGIIGTVCCCIGIAKVNKACFEKQVTDWNILSLEVPQIL